MTRMLIIIALCAICFAVSRSEAAAAEATAAWEVFQLELAAASDLKSPYVDGLPDSGEPYVRVVFRGEGGESAGQRVEVTGFWDGQSTWRARFAAPAAGNWVWRSQSADSGLDGREGRLECRAWSEAEKQANPTRRGFVRVCGDGPRPGRYFAYADGTPMLWLGDTWWNWTKRSIPFERFQKLVDDRAAKGFNVGQLFFAANGWGRESSLLDRTWRVPDLEHIRHVERMIAYANSQGITVWIHPWWSRAQMDKNVGAGEHPPLVEICDSSLGGLQRHLGTGGRIQHAQLRRVGLEFWNGLGRLVKQEDPYQRIVSAHPTPPGWTGGDDAPSGPRRKCCIHRAGWTITKARRGTAAGAMSLLPKSFREAYQQQPPKPIVVTEPWYEFVEGNPTAADIRLGGWSAILSGAGGAQLRRGTHLERSCARVACRARHLAHGGGL